MKKRNRWCLLALLLALCLLGVGCHTAEEADRNDEMVYVVYGSGYTFNEWENEYGAMTRAGDMILPLDTRQVEIIVDEETGQQLWLQTREMSVADPTLTMEDLYLDGKEDQIQSDYKLYDLTGELIQDLGERAVMAVYGNLVLYSDDKLEDRQTADVIFDDVNELYKSDGYYVMDCADFTTLRITDEKLQVLQEITGSGRVNGDRILLQQDGLMGVIALDGSQIVPCEYDYIQYALGTDKCIAQRGSQSDVLSLIDGSSLYHIDQADTEITYADDDVLLVRSQVITEDDVYDLRVQMFNYQGDPVSAAYNYMGAEAENGIYEEGEDTLFTANTTDQIPVLLNQRGEVLYRGNPDGWINLVSLDRLIHSEANNSTAVLMDFEGNVKNTRSYEGIYPVYLSNREVGYSQKAPLVIGYYTQGTMLQLQDLMDLDGNLLIEQAKYINPVDLDRFWVEQGFSQGLMDGEGNWLYKQSLFDSSVDE